MRRKIATLLFLLEIPVTAFTAPGALEDQLLTACRKGDLAQVRRCVEACVESNSPRFFSHMPLFVAVSEGRDRVVEYLLSVGADPNARDDGGRSLLRDLRSSALVSR